MKKGYILFVLCFMFLGVAFADVVGTIRGTVVAADTNEPLTGVNILVDGTTIGTFTDNTGYYTLINLPIGNYDVAFNMIGYKKLIQRGVHVTRDQSTNINVRLEVEVVQGEVVEVVAERPAVEKDIIGRKITMETEQVVNLPVRDMSEVYTLQSGIIEIKNADLGIPGFEDRGIEQIHVRGGRANETGFMIDGMYIENPIYGGKGKGTRLNQFAVATVDFQTGFFNAKYGDAMSGMINTVTRTGPEEFTGSFRLERSDFGPLSSRQDQIRGYKKIAGGFGGPIPFTNKQVRFWTSFDDSKEAYAVYEFDDIVFNLEKPRSIYNTDNSINPLDTIPGWRSFGFDNTFDIFSKLSFIVSPKMRFSTSYWYVNSNYKTFDPSFMYNEEGKNETSKISNRFTAEWRHQISDKTYYTINYSDFIQEMTMGVRNYDTDGDGYPDWIEERYYSDIQNPNSLPLFDYGDGSGNVPVQYIVTGLDTIWRVGDGLKTNHDSEQIPDWCISPDMYNQPEGYTNYWLGGKRDDIILKYGNSPNLSAYGNEFYYSGSDDYYHYTRSHTREIKFDITSQVSRHNQLQAGLDYKTHDIYYNEIVQPYLANPNVEYFERKPQEFAGYLQDKIEYPWMVINAGLRFDAANTNDIMWSDPRNPDTTTIVPTEWEYLWSPRLGFSHVITEKSTFTFGYGVYYQNPTYRDVYTNVDARDDIDKFFQSPNPIMGNPGVTAQRVTSYEFGINTEFSPGYVFGAVGWTKDYSSMNSTEKVNVGSVSYTVFVNYDYGSSRGFDFIIEKRRGKFLTGNIQYTYSVAKGNHSDPWAGYLNNENPLTMPRKEILQSYDRTHDLSAQLTFKMPKGYGIPVGNYNLFQSTMTNLTFVGISGAPYTPVLSNDQYGPENSERMPFYFTTNMAFRKYISIHGSKRVVLGFVCTNLFNKKNVLMVYPRTGDPENPGGIEEGYILDGTRSSTIYDRPWYYDEKRNIDFFIEVEF